jgi:DNA-binding NtrC family response regulator
LVALPSAEESAPLRKILADDEWILHFAWTYPAAEAILRATPFGVVICPRRFADGHGWKDLLNEVQQKPIPPPIIVADRLADEALWAEVLNLGCYDLLMTPFVAEEVMRVVSMAWGFWERTLERAMSRPKPVERARQRSTASLASGAD